MIRWNLPKLRNDYPLTSHKFKTFSRIKALNLIATRCSEFIWIACPDTRVSLLSIVICPCATCIWSLAYTIPFLSYKWRSYPTFGIRFLEVFRWNARRLEWLFPLCRQSDRRKPECIMQLIGRNSGIFIRRPSFPWSIPTNFTPWTLQAPCRIPSHHLSWKLQLPYKRIERKCVGFLWNLSAKQ